MRPMVETTAGFIAFIIVGYGMAGVFVYILLTHPYFNKHKKGDE